MTSRSAYGSAFLGAEDRGPWTSFGGVDAGECSFPVTKITTPGYVDSFKARLDTLFDDTDTGVQACAGLAPADRTRWTAFYASWKVFAGTPSSLFGTSNLFDQACAFARQLDAWRETIAKTCTIPGPTHIESENAAANALVDVFKWVAVAGIGIGGVLLLMTYAPEIKAFLPSKK